ncbi:MAG: EAL domain-containing protein [Rhodoferax sp.]|nr:EAL domain-containing protein [Rhodoferax sp.]HQZ05046.1 EAL domain-containing protein [Burkholderiaceae bacterium]
MKSALPRRVRLTIVLGAAMFLLIVALVAWTLIDQGRRAAMAEAERNAIHFVSGAESAVNRNLLSVDILLASMDQVLNLAGIVAEWIDVEQSSRLMRASDNQNLLVSRIALISATGKLLVSSDRSGPEAALDVPQAFLDAVLSQPVSTLTFSEPFVSFSSSEPALYLARSIKLADSSRVVALAEVRVPLLTTIMEQGMAIPGLEITLERADGQLLCSVPPNTALTGTRLSPPLSALVFDQRIAHAPARLSGMPAILVSRPTLYGNISIAASIPVAFALNAWRQDRTTILAVAGLIAVMILGSAALALRHLGRLSQAREQILEGKVQLEATLDAMPDSLLELGLDGQYFSSHAPHPALLAHAPGLFDNGRIADHLPAAAAQTISDALQEANDLGGSNGKQFALGDANASTWFELSVARKTSRPGEMPHFIVISRDITTNKAAAHEIEQLAFYDPLTRLPNRRLLMDRLQHAMAASARSGRLGALMFMDLDHFKTINDTLGHDIGDILLQNVAERLRASVREADTVARLGGDEFVVMLEDLDMPAPNAAAQTELIGEKIIAALDQPYHLGQHTLSSTPSIGITLFIGHEQSVENLLKQADIAMYQAKTSGRNAIRFYDPAMQAAITARTALEHDLRIALEQEQFVLHYQPQVTHDGRTVGAEVLIRWQHPARGMVSPMEFIPLAEETGQIVPIGSWVLDSACRQLKAWETEPQRQALELAVNVSARQFHAPDFVQGVAQTLRTTAANPARLKLELTESLVLDDIAETTLKMNQLKALGVRFSMDDFGTGQSSLSYLTQLPLDQLKIDQSFVRNIGVKATDGIIVQTIIGLASKLSMEVIAEGVETRAQQEFLQANGCAICQGYLLGRPMPLDAFERFLA